MVLITVIKYERVGRVEMTYFIQCPRTKSGTLKLLSNADHKTYMKVNFVNFCLCSHYIRVIEPNIAFATLINYNIYLIAGKMGFLRKSWDKDQQILAHS